MNSLDASIKSNQYQFYGLVTLRFLIGWHFLYEGISKLLNPYWSSAAYLLDSKWIFSGIADSATPAIVTNRATESKKFFIGLALLIRRNKLQVLGLVITQCSL